MPRNPLLGLALDVAGAGLRSARRSLDVAGDVVDELRGNVGDAARTAGTAAGRALDAADIGVGDARLTSEGAEWARRQLGRGLRQLLVLPEDAQDRLVGADPTTLARAVLQLLGADTEVLPLPTVEQQVRERFAALLDPTAADTDVTPALLAVTAQLCPDEARVLRHLAEVGRAPTVTVEHAGLTGRDVAVLAEHLSVVVERSGGDHPERGPAYVANLLRLGLCRLDERGPSDDPDADLVTTSDRYREAMARGRAQRGRTRAVVRWLRLSELGDELVRVALAPDAEPEPPPPPRAALGGPT